MHKLVCSDSSAYSAEFSMLDSSGDFDEHRCYKKMKVPRFIDFLEVGDAN